jgi:transposase
MSTQKRYPPELRERAVRLALESGRPIAQVARDLGVGSESLRHWVRQAQADAGQRAELLSSGERERLKALERENRELRKANEILKAASVFFAGELDPSRSR